MGYKPKIVGETKFFREKRTFYVLKKLIEENNIKKFKVWSAACATGEEPYSLAILFYEMGLKSKYVKIYATDICQDFLKKASTGIYTRNQIERSEYSNIINYFKKIDDERYIISNKIKEYVRFELFDLTDFSKYDKYRENFTFIFLRNVLIYFPIEIIYKIFKKTFETLEEGGYLFTGNKELFFLDNNLRFNCSKKVVDNIIFYKKEKYKKLSTKRNKEINFFEYNFISPKKNKKENIHKILHKKELIGDFFYYITQGDIGKAKKISYVIDPKSFEYYFIKGFLEELMGKEDLAEKFYKKAIEINPEFPLSHLHLGNIYYNRKDYIKAYKEYILAREAIELKGILHSIISEEEIDFIKNFIESRVGI